MNKNTTRLCLNCNSEMIDCGGGQDTVTLQDSPDVKVSKL
jgi:hypothetical protein